MAGDLGRAGLANVHDDDLLIFPGAVARTQTGYPSRVQGTEYRPP